MKKLLSIAAVLATTLMASDVMPYGAFIDYSGSTTKDKAGLVGVYMSTTSSPFKLELDAEYVDIKYKDTTPNYKQTDLTVVGNYYYGKNYAYKIGIHNMFIDQKDNSDKYDNVVFAGATYYEYLKYNVGVDVYMSTYDNFKAYQISPKYGFNFGNYYAEDGAFYAEAKLNYIHISKSGYTSKTNYTDIDLKLENYKGPWATTISGSFGKNAYKVANGGFTVYNLGEDYKYSYGLAVKYSLDKVSSVKVSYNRSKFSQSGADSYSNVFLVSYLRAF